MYASNSVNKGRQLLVRSGIKSEEYGAYFEVPYVFSTSRVKARSIATVTRGLSTTSVAPDVLGGGETDAASASTSTSPSSEGDVRIRFEEMVLGTHEHGRSDTFILDVNVPIEPKIVLGCTPFGGRSDEGGLECFVRSKLAKASDSQLDCALHVAYCRINGVAGKGDRRGDLASQNLLR